MTEKCLTGHKASVQAKKVDEKLLYLEIIWACAWYTNNYILCNLAKSVLCRWWFAKTVSILYVPAKRLSKKEGKDQESIQSSTTPDPGHQLDSDNLTIRHHKREFRVILDGLLICSEQSLGAISSCWMVTQSLIFSKKWMHYVYVAQMLNSYPNDNWHSRTGA